VFGGEKPASRQESRGDIVVGSDVWIASNALILSGVTIGDGAVVGLGAVVLHDVPPYAIVFGNPARVVGKRFSDEVIAELLELHWWDLPARDVEALRPLLVEPDIEAFLVACRKCRGLPPTAPRRPPLQSESPVTSLGVCLPAELRPSQPHARTAVAISDWCVNYLAMAMDVP